MLDHAGPSALIVKAVVDHADGSRETFVSDGTWKISKANEYTNGTITTRNGDSGDRAERYDARAEQAGWNTAGFDDSAWQPAYAIGPHPRPPKRPARDLPPPRPRDLAPRIRGAPARTHHPARRRQHRRRLRPRHVRDAEDRLRERAGRPPGRRPDQLPPQQHDAGRGGRNAGDTTIKVAGVGNFVVGDKITVDQAANGYGKGDPEVRTITAVGTAGATGTGITLDQPLSRNHASARFVEGSRAGTSQHDTQGSNLGWWWTQKDGPQTAQAFTYWGWRYLQILPPGAGETPKISAVVQHSAAPRNRRATFDSDNATLDAVFELMQRSGIYSSEEVFLDTPTREKGQFTGDTVDISYANMIASGDRNASARAIREILYSATHSWKAPPAATAPPRAVLIPEHRHPRPRQRRLPERRQHARHPRLHADDARLGVALLRAVR